MSKIQKNTWGKYMSNIHDKDTAKYMSQISENNIGSRPLIVCTFMNQPCKFMNQPCKFMNQPCKFMKIRRTMENRYIIYYLMIKYLQVRCVIEKSGLTYTVRGAYTNKDKNRFFITNNWNHKKIKLKLMDNVCILKL